MIQIFLQGKILETEMRKNPQTRQETAIVALEVRTFRGGIAGTDVFFCTFNEYWTKRLVSKPEKIKYITVRGSDVSVTTETLKGGEIAVYKWVKAEEYF